MSTLRSRFDSIDLQFIQDAVAERRQEDLYLEFKTVSDASLARDDRRNLAAGISGFANALGGIIVWGVEARPDADRVDCAISLLPISPLSRLQSALSQHAAGAVSPILDGVEHRTIFETGDSGFAVTLVPEGDGGPYMAKLGEDRYFKRSGTSFLKMEHFEIADMFGRRRRPVISAVVRPSWGGKVGQDTYFVRLVLALANSGRGVARSPYVALKIDRPYIPGQFGLDGNGRLGLGALTRASDDPWIRYGGGWGEVIHPDSQRDVTVLEITNPMALADIPDFSADVICGAEDVPLAQERITVPADAIREAIVAREK